MTTDPIDSESTLASRVAHAAISGSRLIEPSRQGGAAWFHWYARGPAILAAVGELIASIREEQESFDRVLATVLFPTPGSRPYALARAAADDALAPFERKEYAIGIRRARAFLAALVIH